LKLATNLLSRLAGLGTASWHCTVRSPHAFCQTVLLIHVTPRCVTGDIKATRLVIYGALLGVLDPALTLAAAGDVDGTRLPNEAMLRAAAAQDIETKPTSSDSELKAAGSAQESAVQAGRVQFKKARDMQSERRLELAGEQVGDHAVTLGAYQVRRTARVTYYLCAMPCH
jgi:hypothetical protein